MGDLVSDLILGGSSKTETSKPKYSLGEVQQMIYGQESNSGKMNTSVPNYAGAHGPMQIRKPTWEGGQKQGIIPKEYDINNPVHNKAGGDALIADAYNRHKGDVDKVMAEYYAGAKAIEGDKIRTDFKDLKNPNAPTVGQYIEQAKGRLGDEVSRLIMGSATSKEPETKPTSSTSTSSSLSDIKMFGKGKVSEGIKPTEVLASASEKNKPIAESVASLADTTIGSIIPSAGSYLIQGVTRPFTTAEKAQEYGQKFAEATDKPFGKALGVTESPAYKGEASNRLMQYVGENIEKGAGYISEQTGIPKADAEHMINSFMALGGKGVSKVAPVVGEAVSTAAEKVKNVPGNIKQGFAEKFPVMEQELQGSFLRKKAEAEAKAKGEMAGAPEVSTVSKPYEPNANFVEHEFTEKGLPSQEVTSRKELLNRTAPDLKVDPNVFEGRGRQRADDYAVSLTNTPEGHLLANKFAEEKQAQVNYGNKLIDETGGTRGLDESARYRRDETVLKPLEDLGTELNTQIEKLYRKRDQEAVGVPVVADEVQKVLNTKSEVLASTETKALAEAATERLKELGIMDKDGNLLPANALQAEKFRQYLNDKWNSKNATLNKALKEAIDNDVFANAPDGIHNDARALYKYRKDTLDNPKGISSVLDSSGPNGINRKVNLGDVTDKITSMPVDQFTHIIKTLDSMPESLQKTAQAAKSEIKAHFLNKLEKQFDMSAKKGTDFLNNNKEVFNRLFTPEEMAKINDRNSMAHVLKTDTGYKGSAVQTENLGKRGIGRQMLEQTVKKGGALAAEASVGGSSGGLAALGAHHVISSHFEKSAAKRTEAAQVKAAKKKQAGFTNLNDIGKEK